MDSLTLATFPLEAGGGCEQMPSKALGDMSPSDVLLTVFFTGPATADDPPWPSSGFDANTLQQVDPTAPLPCTDRGDVRVHWGGEFDRAGVAVYVLVAVGEDARRNGRPPPGTRFPRSGHSTTAPMRRRRCAW